MVLGWPLICTDKAGGVSSSSLSLSCLISHMGIIIISQGSWKNSISQCICHRFVNSNTKANYCFYQYYYLNLCQAHRDYWINRANYDSPPRVYGNVPSFKDSRCVFLSQNVRETLKSYSLSSSCNWLWDESCFVDLPSQSLNKRLVNNNDLKNPTHSLLNPTHVGSPTYISLKMVFMNISIWKKDVSSVVSSIVKKKAN